MAETTILYSLTLPVRTDPLVAPTPQTLTRWADVLAFLHHLAALAAAGTAFQLVEKVGQVACVVGEAPTASAAPVAKTPRARRASAKA
ncbi:MAG: hypothetical protein AB7N91_31960 [Candidatus Tectimicrobiota bacterium]